MQTGNRLSVYHSSPSSLFRLCPPCSNSKGLHRSAAPIYRTLVNSASSRRIAIYNRPGSENAGFPLTFLNSSVGYLLPQPPFSHFRTLNMTGGGYDKVRSQSKSTEEQNAVTTARIKQIQSQLDSSVRSGKLKGKVCIVTGVGSLKGIG